MPSISSIKDRSISSIKDRFRIRSIIHKRERSHKGIGLLVDGPNMLRKEFQIDLEEIRNTLKEFGDIKVGRVYLNQYASEKLVEAIENQGFEPVVSSSDVDVRLAVEATELIFNPNIDIIAIVTRDADFKPVLSKAMEHGKETIIFGAEPGFSVALKNLADVVVILNGEEYVKEISEDDETAEPYKKLKEETEKNVAEAYSKPT